MVTVAFGLITYFLKKQGGDKRPIALDPSKKIPFKLVDKKVFNMSKWKHVNVTTDRPQKCWPVLRAFLSSPSLKFIFILTS